MPPASSANSDAGPVREHLAHQPARVARQLRAQRVALRGGLGEHLGDQRRELRRDRLDLQQRVDPGRRDLAPADERLRALRELEDPPARGHAALAPAQHRGGAVDGVAVAEHLLDLARLLQRRELLAQDVLGALVAAAALGLLADLRGDRRPPELARGREPVRAGDQREPLAVDGDDVDRRQQAPHLHRRGQPAHVLPVQVADVAAGLDLLDGDLLHAARGHRGSGHEASSFMRLVAPPGAGPVPSPTARASVLAVWEGPARIPARSATRAGPAIQRRGRRRERSWWRCASASCA